MKHSLILCFLSTSIFTLSADELIINGHQLPPEPDPKINNATLLGVDVNHNGVRDDVERWIYDKYRDKHPVHIDIAMQAGRAWQKVLENPKNAYHTMKYMNAAIDCESYYLVCFEKKDIKINNDINGKTFDNKVLNTENRKNAYIMYDTLLSGDIYTIGRCSERKKCCDFNTSKYE